MGELNSIQLQAIETRKRIADAALDLFKEQPYEQVKISEICKRANISIGNFYHYFKSKEAIVVDAYNAIDNDIITLYHTKYFESPTEAILWLNTSAATIIASLGVYFTSNCYRQLFIDDLIYTISPERTWNKELIHLLYEADKVGELIDTNLDNLSSNISKVARGNIFDWCIKKGSVDLVTCWTTDVRNILSMYLKAS